MSWWTHSDGPFEWTIGLRQAQFCGAERCDVGTLDRLQWNGTWFRAGAALYAAALLAAGLLVAYSCSAAVGRLRSLLTSTTLVAVVSAGVTGVLFVWTVPDYPNIRPGYSMYSFFAGVIAGALACLVGLRATRPAATPA